MCMNHVSVTKRQKTSLYVGIGGGVGVGTDTNSFSKYTIVSSKWIRLLIQPFTYICIFGVFY